MLVRLGLRSLARFVVLHRHAGTRDTRISAIAGFPLKPTSHGAIAAEHQKCPVCSFTNTGSRMTTNITGKMHAIIGSESLSGSA